MTHAALMAAIRDEAIGQALLIYHGRPANDYLVADDDQRWHRGFPDLVIAGPGGQLFVEVKTARGRLEPEQWLWADVLLRGGAACVCWRPDDWPETIKEQLTRLAKV